MALAQKKKRVTAPIEEFPAEKRRRRPAEDQSQVSFPGAALVDALLKKAEQEKLQDKELAHVLGISPTHFSFVRSGERRPGGLADEVLRAAAAFLEKPVVEIYHLAEKLTLEDYYYHLDLEDRLDKLYESMREDLIYGSLSLSRKMWSELPLQAKVLIGTMYEQHARTNLLPRPLLRPIVLD